MGKDRERGEMDREGAREGERARRRQALTDKGVRQRGIRKRGEWRGTVPKDEMGNVKQKRNLPGEAKIKSQSWFQN